MTEAQAPANIAAALVEMAARQPFAPAIYFPDGRDSAGKVRYTHYTYQQLDQQSDRVARGLELMGIGRGTRTVLMVKPSLDLFALTFGLFKAGVVPVMVDPGIGIKKLGACLAEARPTAFIGIPAAHAARVVLGWARGSVSKLVTVGSRWFWGGQSLVELKERARLDLGERPYAMAPTPADETAAILFTSGATGIPKGVVYQHRTFAAQVAAIRTHYDIRPGEVDLPTFPLFALFDPALGMSTVVPDMDFTKPAKVDPRKIVEAVEDFGVTNLFGSPALLDTVGRYGEAHGARLPTVRRVISAGAPVPASVIARLMPMLAEGAVLHTGYGATESMPVASLDSGAILGETAARTAAGEGVCVGQAVGEMEIAIIGITDEAIPTWDPALALPSGQIGEIVVKGPVVTRLYDARPEATALAKIADGEAVRHRMGDLGWLDTDGRLWMCGRKVHRVETAQGTLFTVPCEAVVNAHPAVRRSALVGIGRGEGTVPVLVVELEPGATVVEATLLAELAVLAAANPLTASIQHFLVHPGLPVDIRHNAKIDRPLLAAWAAGRLP